MIRARQALYGALRSFVEGHLRGILSWDERMDGAKFPAEDVQVVSRGRVVATRRNPTGPFKEVVEVRFFSDEYVLRAYSADEKPPLGWVDLEIAGDPVQGGPLDDRTWAMLGLAIRKNEEVRHGGRG